MRRSFGALFLTVAVALGLLATLLAYELTSEYGYSPNDDPAGDLTRIALSHALVSLLVGWLVAAGLSLTTSRSRRARAVSSLGAVLLVFVVLAAGVALGQRELDERCAGPERFSTGAC
jgi:Zn-dependent protease with chaperone function